MREVLSILNVITDEVSVFFVSDPFICRLHDRFFQDPSTTDTISLPLDQYDVYGDDHHILGEVFINPAAAEDFLKRQGHPINSLSLYEELTRYLIHTLLHLCGYDDINLEDRKKMKRKENQLLCTLKKRDLLIMPKT